MFSKVFICIYKSTLIVSYVTLSLFLLRARSVFVGHFLVFAERGNNKSYVMGSEKFCLLFAYFY